MPRSRPLAAALGALTSALVAAACGGAGTPPRPVTVPSPPRDAPPLVVGVIANTLGDGTAARMAAAQGRVDALGVHWIREELDWPAAEPEPGVYRWALFDRLFAISAEHHLHVLPLLLGTPRWAGSAPLAIPSDPKAFAGFAAHLATRYGPGGTFWRAHPGLDPALAPRWFEIWNEPYTTAYSSGGVDPAAYARLALDTARAGRAANPRTSWLMAADFLYRDARGRFHNWLDALLAAEPALSHYIGGVAVHPYSYLPPTAGPHAGALEYRFARVGAIERTLRSHHAGRLPMWITELGWSTCSARPQCTSTHDQAQWLAEAFTLVRTRYRRFVRALFVYHMNDGGPNPADAADHFGLSELGGEPKPAWSVVHQEALDAGR